MKYVFQLMLVLFPLAMVAQDKGVHFEHELTWTEVQAKAKAENKYIFMDCFTTWCGPCKYMSANIFPQEEVGSFFNKNFISVKVQMDQTAGDNDGIKKWYSDAKMINDQYAIAAYPTFLYFSPDGKLVHRIVGGGEAKPFIAKSADALDPAKQYYTILDKFNKNTNKKPADIRDMALSAKNIYDSKNAAVYAKQYLATQKDLYTKENIEFVTTFIESSKDKEFEMFLKSGDKIDKVMGAGTAAQKVKSIILKEDIYPNIPRGNGAAKPDWAALKASVAKKYPAQADEVISSFKVQYFQMSRDWNSFQQEVVAYMAKYGKNTSPEELNNFAWTVFENCPDMKCVGEALEWSKRSFKDKENPMYMDTYANILYKMGKKEDAIAWEEKAAALAGGDKTYLETLDKMKKGEKTWKD